MTKKILNTDAITNELEGASLFFSKPAQTVDPVKPVQSSSAPLTSDSQKQVRVKKITPKLTTKDEAKKSVETMVSSNHDTMTPRYHDTMIEIVRSAVKELGKEAATHRFTLEEKRLISDIIYTYKSSGIKTSENEIARIAVNFIVEDYKENGENSVLEKVLKALNK